MKPVQCQRWLSEKKRELERQYVLGAIGCIAGSVIAFLVTRFLILMCLWRWRHRMQIQTGLEEFVTVILGLLFVVNLYVDKDKLEDYSFDSGYGGAGWMMSPMGGFGMRGGVDTFVSSLRLMLGILLIAPRSLMMSGRMMRSFMRLKQMPVSECSLIMLRLVETRGRVNFQDIRKCYPKFDFETVVPILRLINGVVILHEPAGLTLTPALLSEIESWRPETCRVFRP